MAGSNVTANVPRIIPRFTSPKSFVTWHAKKESISVEDVRSRATIADQRTNTQTAAAKKSRSK